MSKLVTLGMAVFRQLLENQFNIFFDMLNER